MKWKAILLAFLVGLVCFWIGWFVSTGRGPGEREHVHEPSTTAAEKASQWTCPMHPQVKQPDPGKCPLCGMDLVELEAGAEDPGPRHLQMSEAGKKLAEIVTAPVERRFVENEVRMVGMVDYDETRIRTISAWVPGRLDRLYVDFTGTTVRKGDHLVWLYSPELLTAQEELLQQKRFVEETKNERSESLRKSSLDALESARDKLRLWGLTDEQIRDLEKSGKAEDHVMIRSPSEGIVIHKALDQGAYVQVGTPIYRIASLDQLWIQLDAYESDLPWIRYGQDVAIETEALPGEVFRGWISFVAPELDRKTRSVKVRVNVANPGEKLKPGMFVRAAVRARIAGSGKVMDPKLAGKWICPMHPEVVADTADTCRVCGMKLVPAKELGYVSTSDQSGKPLVVPASAVLWTGKRAVVYVAVKGKSKPTYEGREVVLGPRAKDHYLVHGGLTEGEHVVVKGAFKIDSALQILAKPSMMSMQGEPASKARVPAAFRQALTPAFERYFDLGDALAGDEFAAAKNAFSEFGKIVGSVRAIGLPPRLHTVWLTEADSILKSVVRAAAATEIPALRDEFREVSRSMLEIESSIGHSGPRPHYETHCPMAFDGQGATWLQANDKVRNPYYGAAMLTCGEVRGMHPGSGKGTGVSPRKAIPVRHEKHDPDAAGARVESAAAGALEPVYAEYVVVQRALAGDDLPKAKAGFTKLRAAAKGVDMKVFEGESHARWMKLAAAFDKAAGSGENATAIESARVAFRDASGVVLELLRNTGHAGPGVRYEVHCSMAFGGKGGSWVQDTDEISNPYYGASMLRCGTVKHRFDAGGK